MRRLLLLTFGWSSFFFNGYDFDNTWFAEVSNYYRSSVRSHNTRREF